MQTRAKVEPLVRSATEEEREALTPLFEILEPTPATKKIPVPVEDDKDDVMYSREPMPTEEPPQPAEVVAKQPAPLPETVSEPVPEPEEPQEITKSSLGLIKADPKTEVRNPAFVAHEIGIGTGAFTTGPKNP